MPTPSGGSRSTKLAAAAALISIAAAAWLSLQPERLRDLVRVAGWASQWLGGAHIYGANSDVDYPPWAIVLLSPLALVPQRVLPLAWVAVNIAALSFAARTLAKPWTMTFFLLMAAGAMRTLNQFSLLAVAFGAAGVMQPQSAFSPLWLGLALMKPQIAIVFCLHAAWQRRWKLLMLSALVPAALTFAYAARAHVGVAATAIDYVRSIELQYAGGLTGQTEITPWLGSAALGVPALIIALLLAFVVFAALASQRPWLGAGLGSLLGFRHLSYDFVVLLPWLATLDGVWIWLAVGLVAIDPSAIFGVLSPGSWLAVHADRVCLVALWLGGLIVSSGGLKHWKKET